MMKNLKCLRCMKNSRFIRLIILALFYLCLPCITLSKNNDADTLIVRFLTWEEDGYPHMTTCSNFENDVPYKEWAIHETTYVDSLYSEIDNLERVKDKDFQVCCKLLIISKEKTIKTICLNEHYLLMDGKTYICSKKVKELIDKIMRTYPSRVNEHRYLPDVYGNEYPEGRDELFKKIRSLLKKELRQIENDSSVRAFIICKVNKKGRTTRVLMVKIISKDLPIVLQDKIKKRLTYILLHKIKWKKDNTRMNPDTITLPFKLNNPG